LSSLLLLLDSFTGPQPPDPPEVALRLPQSILGDRRGTLIQIKLRICPSWIKMRNVLLEKISSAFPLNSGIAGQSQDFAFGSGGRSRDYLSDGLRSNCPRQ
jgi:hypothetical protein